MEETGRGRTVHTEGRVWHGQTALYGPQHAPPLARLGAAIAQTSALGIVQLIQGPQWATGVGLVHYGAQRLAEARHYSAEEAPAAARSEEAARAKSNGSLGRGVLGWLRAAF